MDILLYIIAGGAVGFIVGLTGIGGGALMTPLLLLFGFPPNIAVGTDLMYAAITKSTGVYSHQKANHIQWQVMYRMALGSIPAALVTGLILHFWFTDASDYSKLLSASLGVMLLATASVILLRNKIQAFNQSSGISEFLIQHQTLMTWVMGAFLGVFVTLSSVGAGAIGTAILLILYPAMRSAQIVGTDLAHAVPLTLVGGLIHMALGNVDFYLLGSLLLGSVPAIMVGSKLSQKLPEAVLRPVLASLLMVLGAKYAFF